MINRQRGSCLTSMTATTRISDSTFIRKHIEETYGIDLDAALDERQRAEAWAIERMVENQLYWMLVHMRWLIPENFDRGPSHFFDAAPEEVRDQVRCETRARVGDVVYMAGPGRHALPEIVDLGTRSLSSLSMLLGWRPYLMGDRPMRGGRDSVRCSGRLADAFLRFAAARSCVRIREPRRLRRSDDGTSITRRTHGSR